MTETIDQTMSHAIFPNASPGKPLPEATVQTQSGRYLNFLDPQPEQFTLTDIVSGLAREGRFNGQTSVFYSVAQHSVLASLLVPKEYALIALFHDAAEAFVRDLTTPFKRLLRGYAQQEPEILELVDQRLAQRTDLPAGVRRAIRDFWLDMGHDLKTLMPGYHTLENRLQAAIHRKLGLPEEMPDHVHKAVKAADTVLLATERAQLMPRDKQVWSLLQGVQPLAHVTLRPINEERAFHYFLDRYVSIREDRRFMPELGLWQAQQSNWEARLDRDCQAMTSETVDDNIDSVAAPRAQVAYVATTPD